jgi:hypothetical protein
MKETNSKTMVQIIRHDTYFMVIMKETNSKTMFQPAVHSQKDVFFICPKPSEHEKGEFPSKTLPP